MFRLRLPPHLPTQKRSQGLSRMTAILLAMSLFSVFLFASMTASQTVFAQEEILKFSSLQHEKRYSALIEELRCLVCQNQNIADSNADLAKDLRNKTYELIESGQSDSQIKTFMRDRYGDFVLYEPPLEGYTLLLWFGPIIVLGIVVWLVISFIRRQNNLLNEDV